MQSTYHFERRCQQRGIPLQVIQYLQDFGQEEYDSHGAIKKYFGHQSVKAMRRSLGANFVGLISKFLNAYLVESVETGQIITVGWRTERVIRK
jgi:hypothetical protein